MLERADPGDGLRGEAARCALAASALLLRPPDEIIYAQLQAAGAASGQTLAALRQSFYDRFCIAQSGLYIPPFEHVFRRRVKIGNHWHFPPARFDGGRAVESLYGRFGFRTTELDADPILRAPHLPGDHLGFMLAFAGCLLEAAERSPSYRSVLTAPLASLVATHLDGWVDDYCALLRDSEPDGYPAAVGEAVREAVAEVRKAVADSMYGLPQDSFAHQIFPTGN